MHIDNNIGELNKFIHIIDKEILRINLEIKKSTCPDLNGLYDSAEYFIGYGFIAIQRYMNATYPLTKYSKKDIYKVGYKLKNNLYLVELINAGANYWKHEPEWSFSIDIGEKNDDGLTEVCINRTGINLDGLQKKTFDTITQITPYAEYTLSNLLAEILIDINANTNISFEPILPFIEEWQKKLHFI